MHQAPIGGCSPHPQGKLLQMSNFLETAVQLAAQTFFNCSLSILLDYSYSALKYAPEIRIRYRCSTKDN